MVLTIHHLQVSQSERLVWLCEELSIPYELKTYQRNPLWAPPEYKALHAIGSAPVLQDGPLTLAESPACIEYIAHRHGGGRLFLSPDHPDYPAFLYWWHAANGSFMPAILLALRLRDAPAGGDPVARVAGILKLLEAQLGGGGEEQDGRTWAAGNEFTAADIMLVFGLTTMRRQDPGLGLVLGAEPPGMGDRLLKLEDVTF